MSLKKIFLSLFILLPFISSSSSAQTKSNQGVFTSVSGKVTVTHGKKSRAALMDSKVSEGDIVTTDKNSTATLRLFDGSELKIKAETKFTLSKLQKAGAVDKILKFKLSFGKLLATVKKLATSKSNFEIEAGGVLCGVRGTEYEVDYDPNKNKVDIFVTNGNVWATAGGNIFQYGAGDQGHFHDGKPGQDNGGQGQGNQGKEKQGHTNIPPGPPSSPSNNFSSFYGMGGNRPDPFQPLTGGTPDTNHIAGKTGDDNLLGLGAHALILQFKYPEQ